MHQSELFKQNWTMPLGHFLRKKCVKKTGLNSHCLCEISFRRCSAKLAKIVHKHWAFLEERGVKIPEGHFLQSATQQIHNP
jgi:hypothetical protein